MDEALREAQEARRLDPATPPTLLIMGWIRYYRREYTAAIEIGKQAIEIYPTVPQGHNLLALSYASSGQTELALKESAEAVRLTTDSAVAMRRRAEVLSRIPGHEDEARKIAGELEAISWDRQAAYMVPIYAALHDSERMYRWADTRISSIPEYEIARASVSSTWSCPPPRLCALTPRAWSTSIRRMAQAAAPKK